MTVNAILRSCLIAIPAYNEEKNIAKVVGEIKNLYREADVLVIDDGSTDRTAEVAAAAGAIIVKHPFNMSIGPSRATGYRYALENGFDYVIQLDGDGQHNPQSITNLLNKSNGLDVLNGSRFLSKKGFKMPFLRNLGRIFFSWLLKLTFRANITDPTSGFRLIGKDAFSYLLKYDFFDYPEIESLEALLRGGFKVVEVPVQMEQRRNGKSSIDFFQAVYYMLKVSLSFLIMILQKEDKQFLK